jgi:hypothetical protein
MNGEVREHEPVSRGTLVLRLTYRLQERKAEFLSGWQVIHPKR